MALTKRFMRQFFCHGKKGKECEPERRSRARAKILVRCTTQHLKGLLFYLKKIEIAKLRRAISRENNCARKENN